MVPFLLLLITLLLIFGAPALGKELLLLLIFAVPVVLLAYLSYVTGVDFWILVFSALGLVVIGATIGLAVESRRKQVAEEAEAARAENYFKDWLEQNAPRGGYPPDVEERFLRDARRFGVNVELLRRNGRGPSAEARIRAWIESRMPGDKSTGLPR